MTKYKQTVSDMLEYNHELFSSFKVIHDQYMEDPESNKEEFNQEGEKVMRIIRKYENILCGKSESGKYGKFSSNLSDKFWDEIRIHFPKIDFVGTK